MIPLDFMLIYAALKNSGGSCCKRRVGMRHSQSPGIAFLRHHLQAYLILAMRLAIMFAGFRLNHRFGPHHGELDAAFAE